MKNRIDSNEIEIIGNIILKDGYVTFDSTAERIEILINEFLIKIATDISGWDVLYKNPIDNAFWELIYPNSYLLGSGAPLLKKIDINSAFYKEKYPSVADL